MLGVKDRRRVGNLLLRRELWWVGAACLGFWWLRVFQSPGDQIQLFVNYDVLMYWLPLLREAAAQWRQHTVPLWNPYQAFGMPLLATQQVAALYPLNALYLWLEPGTAWLFTALVHHLIAAVGMYAFGRVLGISRGAALVGGGTYAFSAVVIEKYINLPDEFICMSWLPAMFACAELLLQKRTLHRTAFLAAVWALHILGGDADTIARSALLLGAYLMVRTLGALRQTPVQAAAAIVASGCAAVLALTLTAFQWIPTLELVRHSVREMGNLTAAQQAVFSADLSLLFTNRVCGIPMLSIGSTLPLMLALIGLCLWPRRVQAWFFAVAATALALVAAGPATPVFALARHLPTGTWFRGPQRFLNLWPLCVATLAAAGADVMFGENRNFRGRARVAAMIVAIVVSAQAWVAAGSGKATVWVVVGAITLLPLMIIAAALARARSGVRERRGVAVITFVMICAAPAVLFQPEILSPFRVAAVYEPHADLFAELRRYAPARVLSLLPVADGRSWAKVGTYFEVPVLNDFEPLTLVEFRSFTEALLGGGGQPAGLRELLDVFTGDTAPPRPSYNATLLNLSGVRFVVADAGHEAEVTRWFGGGPRLLPWRRSGSVQVLENADALPRTFFIPAPGVRASGSDCVEALARGDLDPRRELLLDESAPNAAAAEVGRTSSVLLSHYGPSEIQLAVTTAEAGYVVLTDAYYPGWTARVDGVEVPIRRADCFFRAVAVSAGTHTVAFSYAPWSFRLGGFVSLLALVVAGAMLLSGRVRSVRESHFTSRGR
jgi:Bacterial membrane protein YfhO